jgi:3',5'-cyclic AMP phosphodiesterase CpdA
VIRPGLVVSTGDVSVLSPDSAADRETARELHERFTAPLHVVPGNHDVGEPGATPWAGISVTSERVAGFRGAFGADHWIELHEEWALTGINSEIMSSGLPEEAEQWQWLATLPELAGSRKAVLFLHKPAWSPLDFEIEHAIALPAAERDRLLEVLAPVGIAAVRSGHLHRYSTARHGDVLTVSAPSAAFVHVENGIGHLPGLHQVGGVELVLENGTVRPYFRSVPGVIESEPRAEPEFAAAWAEAGAGPLPGSQ